MSMTEQELAAVGRLMGERIESCNQLTIRIYDPSNTTYVPLAHFAADVLSKLVAEGAEPEVCANGCRLWGTAPLMRSFAAWPIAILRCAAAYQLSKESP